MPVLEALDDADAAGGQGRSSPRTCAASRCGRSSPPPGRAGCRCSGRAAHRVKVLAGNGRHDQGVLADVVAPRMEPVDEFLARTRLRAGPGARAGPAHQPGERRHDPAQRHRGRARRRAAPPPRRCPRSTRWWSRRRPGWRSGRRCCGRRPSRRAARRWPRPGSRCTGWTRAGRRCSRRSCPRGSRWCWGTRRTGCRRRCGRCCAGLLAIPMHAGVESLGVASAGAVAAFELARRPR